MLKKQFKFEIIDYLNDKELNEIIKLELKQKNISNYSHDQLLEMNNNSSINFIKCMSNNKLIGYLIFFKSYDFYEIYKIYVNNEYRKLGIASEMISLLGNKDILLEVDSSNLPAINLYKKNNFYEYSTRKRYYKNGNDAILFKKER